LVVEYCLMRTQSISPVHRRTRLERRHATNKTNRESATATIFLLGALLSRRKIGAE
jgi:hypothetical protein